MSEDEHVRRMEEKPDKLHEEPDSVSSPYVKKTGKLTKKEIREQSTKNKSILDWARREDDTPDIPPPKELPDLMQGGYSCSTGIGMKRKRTGMSRGTFRTTTSTWSGRARRSTPVRGMRMSQKLKKEYDNLNISWSLEKEEKVEELLVYQPHHGGDQCHVHHHHEGEVRGDRGHDQASQAEDGADQVYDDKDYFRFNFNI